MNQWFIIAILGGLLLFTFRQDKVINSKALLWAWIWFAISPLLPLLSHYLLDPPRGSNPGPNWGPVFQQIGITLSLIQLVRSLIQLKEPEE